MKGYEYFRKALYIYIYADLINVNGNCLHADLNAEFFLNAGVLSSRKTVQNVIILTRQFF